LATNHDKIAGYYDLVSRIFFGKNLVEAQVCLLPHIPANSRVLIVGGGTGWILEEIAKVHQQGLSIEYIDSSAKMIALSKKRNHGANEINFIHLSAENYNTDKKFDVILTPFFFDIFLPATIQNLFTKLDSLLKKEGLWLYVDFVYDKKTSHLWQKTLLRLMYFFFRVTSHIETQELIDMSPFFNDSYDQISGISHYHNFIKYIVYGKIENQTGANQIHL